MSRLVRAAVRSIQQDEGVGAKVWRSIGRSDVGRLDPFLMLDEFRVSAPAGFPDHPHRGFETVTYMLTGAFCHEDFCGHKGIIRSGDLQWMTAGRGVVHCEMPYGNEEGHGLQLWINLKSSDKMIEPKYQELKSKEIPIAQKDGVKVKVIAGTSMGRSSMVYTRTPILYLDFSLSKNSFVDQEVPKNWNAFIYVLKGEAQFGPVDKPVLGKKSHLLLFENNHDNIHVESTDEDCHFVLIAGDPINEPVEQMGPFVMNTKEELRQAVSDYRSCKNGFENAKDWNSSYAD